VPVVSPPPLTIPVVPLVLPDALSDSTPKLLVPLRLSLIEPSAPVVPLRLSLIEPSAPVVLALIESDPVGAVAVPVELLASLPLWLSLAESDALPLPLSPQPTSSAAHTPTITPTTPSTRRIHAMRAA